MEDDGVEGSEARSVFDRGLPNTTNVTSQGRSLKSNTKSNLGHAGDLGDHRLHQISGNIRQSEVAAL